MAIEYTSCELEYRHTSKSKLMPEIFNFP